MHENESQPLQTNNPEEEMEIDEGCVAPQLEDHDQTRTSRTAQPTREVGWWEHLKTI
jgi:hypothetical protein